MQDNNIINPLNLKVVISKIYLKDDKMFFDFSVPLESKACIYCGFEKTYSYYYRFSKIRDIPIHDKEVIINLKRHRRKCPCCNKIFEIKPDFVSKYNKLTNRLILSFLRKYQKVKVLN